MSYKCGACGNHVPDGQKLLRHVVMRERADSTIVGKLTVTGPSRLEIEREVPVCPACSAELLQLKAGGVPSANALEVVREKRAPSGLKVLDRFPETATAR